MFSFSIKQILISPPMLLIQESKWPWPFSWLPSLCTGDWQGCMLMTCCCCWAANRGWSLHYLDEGKKDLIWNNPVLFFLNFRAKLKTVVLLKHKDFANMFRIRVRECRGQWRRPKRKPVFIQESGLRFHGICIPDEFGSLIINYIWILLAKWLNLLDNLSISCFVYPETEWVVRKYVLIFLFPLLLLAHHLALSFCATHIECKMLSCVPMDSFF